MVSGRGWQREPLHRRALAGGCAGAGTAASGIYLGTGGDFSRYLSAGTDFHHSAFGNGGKALPYPAERQISAGCAHPGILSCVEKVKRTFPGEKLYSLLAGMHLRGCPQERVEETITGLKEAGFTYLIPLHCTGTLAIARMKMAFGKSCLMAEAGKHFSL